MFLNSKLARFFLTTFIMIVMNGCSTIPTPVALSTHEQLKVDTVKASGILLQFEKEVKFEKNNTVEKYLNALARQITREEESLKSEKVSVRIHQDKLPGLKRNFSFPGVLISIPKTLLYTINFENELAAVIALELAQIERRELAIELEKNENPILFGKLSVFDFSQKSLGESIELGTKLMYAAGYDPRGMVALFQKFSTFYLDSTSPTAQKELNYYIKQAQKAKNEFMPSLQPIVRSNEFLRMKKELKGST